MKAPLPNIADRKRERIGAMRGLAEREIVYRCNDAVEIESIYGYEVEVKRVFYNDVEMITWHERYSKAGLWFGLLSVIAGLLIWLLMMTTNDPVAFWVGFWVFFLPNVPILLWFFWPYKYVTIYGRRTSARMRWHFRKSLSWQIYEQMAREISDYQRRHGQPAQPAMSENMAPPVSVQSGPDAAKDDINYMPPHPESGL